MDSLLSRLVESMNDYDKKYDYFIDRTNKHIQLVQKAAIKIVDKYPEFKSLLKQVESHDASKFEEPELSPYIELTWQKKYGKSQDEELKNKINQAALHHISNNSHHPEYHLKDKSDANINAEDRDKSDKIVDASRMPDLDVAEMIADWQAMSEELGTNTAREWFNKQKDVCWHFSEHQEELIDKLLKVFE